MPCSNVEGSVELPLAEYNRLRDVEIEYLKAGDQYSNGQKHMALELLKEIESTGFDLSIGASSMAKDTLKMVVGILKEVVRRAK
jgi:hypothetical protein